MFDTIKTDISRYYAFGYDGSLPRLIFDHQGIWALICYRVGNRIHHMGLKTPFRQIVGAFYQFWWKFIQVTTGIYIPPTVEIGKGFYIGHFGQIIIGPDVHIGDYCNVSQGVTLGVGKRGGEWGVPKLGNRVYLAPGAQVFGPITLGNGTVIGANAVMSKDSPPNSVWAGIPARIIGHTGSEEYLGHVES